MIPLILLRAEGNLARPRGSNFGLILVRRMGILLRLNRHRQTGMKPIDYGSSRCGLPLACAKGMVFVVAGPP